MAQGAIPQWQNGVVAIGARRSGGAEPTLKGTGWLVDLPAGLLCTCAHVAMDCYPHAGTPTFLDALSDGVAIGVGIGESIRWLYRADLRYLSLPSTDVGYPHALPAGWPPAGDDKRLDLAVLQLTTNWDGSPLDPHFNAPGAADWHRAGEPAIALPLGRSTPGALAEGSEVVLLGYGQGKDMGLGSRRTSTTSRGHFQGYVSKADTGEWLKMGLTIYRCAPPRRLPRALPESTYSPEPTYPSHCTVITLPVAVDTVAGLSSTRTARSSGGLSSHLRTLARMGS